jgi:DNA-nicking Smr family endonuclease
VSRRRPGDDEGRRGSFADVVGDVRPLAGRRSVLAPPVPTGRPAGRPEAPEPRRILSEESGSGRAEDVSRAILAKLRAGEPPPDREIDLHGLGARAARARLQRELPLAHRHGKRCVLIIHGRGLHSKSGPVLREALPEWLSSQPLSQGIMAFASAPRGLGGPGATLVLLRRDRDPAVSSAARKQRKQRDLR